jgi:hypothetical protein
MDKEFLEVCGNNAGVECIRHISSGAFGDVYEVRSWSR